MINILVKHVPLQQLQIPILIHHYRENRLHRLNLAQQLKFFLLQQLLLSPQQLIAVTAARRLLAHNFHHLGLGHCVLVLEAHQGLLQVDFDPVADFFLFKFNFWRIELLLLQVASILILPRPCGSFFLPATRSSFLPNGTRSSFFRLLKLFSCDLIRSCFGWFCLI